MLRLALILTTIIATTLGSLGLPIYLHTCRMLAMQVETDGSGCSMCSAREDGRPVVPASAHDDSGSCCDDSVVHQRTDPGTMTRADVPMPLFVAIMTFVALELEMPLSPTLPGSDRVHSPPGLAARTQHTYLLNSTFLI